MIREDYIMRMVKQFTRAVTKILRLKESHKYHAALKTVNETFQKLFGLNSEVFDSLSTESIIELLKLEHSEIMQKCFWVAKLIKEEAEIYESQKDSRISESKYLKSLELYLEGITYGDNSNVYDYFTKIKEIIDKFEQSEIPNRTKYKLLRYYEKIENYSKVEDLLFELLELEEDKRDIIEYGISFYNNLLTKSDKELIDENLPRDKVIKSKLRLDEMKSIS